MNRQLKLGGTIKSFYLNYTLYYELQRLAHLLLSSNIRQMLSGSGRGLPLKRGSQETKLTDNIIFTLCMFTYFYITHAVQVY